MGAAAVLAATAAVAGTGVGGGFNLGQTNTVNAPTTLTGASANGAQLNVTNTSTAGSGTTGLSVTGASTRPPIAVSNNRLIEKLNAQYVGGLKANALSRVGGGSDFDLSSLASDSTQLTVSITAPAKGGAGTHSTSLVLPVHWVFPVTPGVRTYSLTTARSAASGDPFGLYNPTLVAQFVPFGSTGSATALSASATGSAAEARRVPLGP